MYPGLGGQQAASQHQGNANPRQNYDAEQVSLEEFLDSCQASSLLAELDDEEVSPIVRQSVCYRRLAKMNNITALHRIIFIGLKPMRVETLYCKLYCYPMFYKTFS